MSIQSLCLRNTIHSKYTLKKILKFEHNYNVANRNKQGRLTWIAKRYLEFFKNDPKMKFKVLKNMLSKELKLDVKKMTLYRARAIALVKIESKHLEQCGRIRDYAKKVMGTNLGS